MPHSTYLEFDIQTVELGRGLWHASICRIDGNPIFLQQMPFQKVEVGVAWPTSIAAANDAIQFIDRLVSPKGGAALSLSTEDHQRRGLPQS
jgi:hypothetical protein